MNHGRFIFSALALTVFVPRQTALSKDTLNTVLAYSAGVRLAHHGYHCSLSSLQASPFPVRIWIASDAPVEWGPGDTVVTSQHSSTALRITGEVLVGSASGVLFALGGGVMGAWIDSGLHPGDPWSGFGGAMLGAGVGFLAGIPLGVYGVGHAQGKSATYGGTLLSSLAGAVVGVAFNAQFHPKGVAGIGPLVFPLVGSVLCVELTE